MIIVKQGQLTLVVVTSHHISPHHTTNHKVVRIHFMDKHRRVMLKFHIFSHFVPVFTFKKISVKCVFDLYFMNVSSHKIPSRVTIYFWATVVLFWCICSGFVSFCVDDADTLVYFVGIKKIRHITNYVRFFLFIVCPSYCPQWNLLLKNFYHL